MQNAHTRNIAYTFFYIFKLIYKENRTEPTVFSKPNRNRTELEKFIPNIPKHLCAGFSAIVISKMPNNRKTSLVNRYAPICVAFSYLFVTFLVLRGDEAVSFSIRVEYFRDCISYRVAQ